MTEETLIQLAAIIVIGILGQWIGWRIHLPAILLLLLFGILAGPVTGFIQPDHVLGDLLFPIVSLSVALILFEGGLSLRISELRTVGRSVRNLVTLGALVVWIIASASAYFLLGLNLPLAILLGAILIVSGPTVVLPLLLHVRPTAKVSSILKWEGIVIDPIGATLAVLVFEAIISGEPQAAASHIAIGILKTTLVGGFIGAAGAWLMIALMRRDRIPEYLQNPVALILVIGLFTLSNMLQSESGLLTVTVMGIVLANQKRVDIRHIVEFKENLRILLLSGLFIILAARINMSELTAELTLGDFAFVGVLILIARPLSVLVSTSGNGLSLRERGFLAWMAPRGIVAASVASVFAFRLAESGIPQAERLVPITFLVIIASVTLYGLTSRPVARWLKVAQTKPQGVLILGGHDWAVALAEALQKEGFKTRLVDTNWAHVFAARQINMDIYHGNILSEEFLNETGLEDLGRLIAITSNDEVNSLATLRFSEYFGKKEVYQLSCTTEGAVSAELRGRILFAPRATYDEISRLYNLPSEIITFAIPSQQKFNELRSQYDNRWLPLFQVSEEGQLQILTSDGGITPRAGQKLIAMVAPTS